MLEWRQYYWIVNGISTVRRVLRKCHVCRRLTGKVGEQLAAPLPEVRVSSDEYRLVFPFAAVGIDYFGPLESTTLNRLLWSKSGEEESEIGEALRLHIHLFEV